MKRLILLTLLLVGCSEEAAEPEKEAADKIATNLEIPWAINQQDSIFYISERVGTIAVIDGSTVTHEEVIFSDTLSSAAEAGLLGFVLKSDFSKTNEAFAYYTYDKDGESFNRVVTLKRENNEWQETEIHLDDIKTGNIHHGGRLEIGPDHKLYVTIGDAGDPELAQDDNSLNGKIVRMEEDGSFQIFSSGHRNPQGLAWHENGTLFEAEHGQSANDEVNLIEQGKNYGYPIIEGSETKNGYVTPLITSGSNETWAPSGITFHKGKLYVASLRGEAVKVMNVETGKVEQSITGFGRVRDVFSNGESLYFVTNNTDGRGNPSMEDDILYKLN
ncbi:PQQ-dependent sugar dehydrogenase [uncultured Psychrobacillus sp.]|uniref:PQQ-dependent sugar dehydrogenase n=1 Tax=uncultured Psychrobacillus sp. TaxID=1551585 RepID=UPI00260F8567|nr:PQQ-dependent sugar dehydrogenase [uncultured Psychrobacillus sp.]